MNDEELFKKHCDAYRAQARANIEKRIAEERAKIDAEEMARALNGSVAPLLPSAHPVHDTDADSKVHQRYPRGSFISVNPNWLGRISGAARLELYRAIVQHLGTGELPRSQLSREIATLVGPEKSKSVTSQITALLDAGALLARWPR